MRHPKKKLDPFLPVFSHFFMSYFDVFGSIFDICAMTDLPIVIVLICLVSYNFCMIPHVWRLTFGLNLSGAWGAIRDSRTRECSEYINFGKLKMDHIQLALRLYHFILWSMFGIPAVPSHQPAPVSRQWTESEYWAACLHKKLNTCSVKTERIRSRHSINSVCQTQTRPSLPSLLSTIHNLIRIRKQ